MPFLHQYSKFLFFVALYLPTVCLAQFLPFESVVESKRFATAPIKKLYLNANQELVYSSGNKVYKYYNNTDKELFDFEIFNSKVNDILFDEDYSLIGTDSGLFELNLITSEWNKVYDKSAVKTIQLLPGSNKKVFFDQKNIIIFDSSSHIPLMAHQGAERLFKFANTYILSNTKKAGISIYNQLSDDDKAIKQLFVNQKITSIHVKSDYALILQNNQIWRLNSDLTLDPVFAQKNDAVFTHLFEDVSGNIWLGSSKNGLYVFDGIQLKEVSKENLKVEEITFIGELYNQNLWIAAKQGIYYLDNHNPIAYYSANKLHEDNKFISLFYDDQKKNAQLITRLRYSYELNFQELTQTNSANLINPLSPIAHYAVQKNGRHQLAVDENGRLLHMVNENTKLIDLPKLNWIDLILLENNAYLLASNESLFQFNLGNNRLKKISNNIKAIRYKSNHNLLALSANKELLEFVDGKQKSHELAMEISDFQYASIDSSVVFISNRKLYQLRNGEIKQIDTNLEANISIETLFIIQNSLWLGSQGDLIRMDMVYTNDGISLQNPQNIGGYLPFRPSLIKSILKADNEIWYILSDYELAIFNPFKFNPDLSPPGIELKSIKVQKENEIENIYWYEGEFINIDAQKGDQIIISADAIVHSRVHVNTIFKNKNEKKWQKGIEANKVILTNLSYGENIYEIRSQNENGLISEKAFFIIIQVETPFWANTWFLFSSLLAVISLGFISYRTVISVKDNRSKEMEERLDKELLKIERRSHEQMLKAEKLKQLNDLITAQKDELENKNRQIEGQKYELALTNEQIKKQKDLIQETSNKLQSSINYAQRIQNALMPDIINIKSRIEDSFIFFKARDHVSGDFFWFKTIINEAGEEEFIIAAVDCTGHGVPGAIVSVVGINLLDVIVMHKKIYDPGQILTEMNKDIRMSLHHDQTDINDGMDMSILRINKKQNMTWFAGAKNPVFFVREGEIITIKGDKYPIGGQQREKERIFSTHEIPLIYGEKQMFYLFSDGYQDQFGGEDKFKFLTKNFREMLLQISDWPVMDQKYELERRFLEWKGELAQTDDILVIGLRL